MKNSIIVIAAVLAVGLAKSQIGGANRTNSLSNIPKGEYFTICQIAKLSELSEHQVVKALYKLKKQGKVWENAGLYMFV